MEEKQKSILSIPGTKPSFHNAQLLVSSGIPSLDPLLGDGIPVGTISLVEEDSQGTYARIILKYFLAEGIVNKHSILIASQEMSPKNIINQLPAVVHTDPEPIKTQTGDKMKIAFRYHNLPTTEEDLSHQFGHYYDLSKTMPVDELDEADVHYWDGEPSHITSDMFTNPAYDDLLRTIKMKIRDGNFFLNDPSQAKSILRIGIHGLGSPMWMSEQKPTIQDLNKFLYCLRALVRSAFVVALVTVPTHLFREYSFDRCVHSSDVVIRLQALAGTELEHNKYLSEYHGYFHIDKLAAVNSFVSKHPGSVEYMFKLRRKKFCIEKLHLPPDLEVSKDNASSVASLGCGSNSKHLLEF